MRKFSIEKKGYSIDEVDEYILNKQLEQDRVLKEKQDRIDELRQENFSLSKQLESFKNKQQSISQALIDAKEKATEIEKASKLKYNLELKNLDDFYAKWQKFFNELLIRYPMMQDFDTNKVLQNLKADINSLLKNEFHAERVTKRNNSFESLLDKLKSHRTNTREKVVLKINKTPQKQNLVESENEIEYMNESNKVNNIKPITNLTLSSDDKEEYDSLLDKFLHTQNNVSKGYEDSILNKGKKSKKESNYPEPNESGFDLEQALNPTEDLLKIMQGFKLD
ncbi:MAG: hypothetical protein ACI4TI_03910 [Christensenellales bacterium]